MMQSYLGIDIGGTKCATVMAQSDWNKNVCTIMERQQMLTEGKAWREVLDTLTSSCLRIEKRLNLHAVSVGVSCGGPLNSNTGVILSPPNLPLWNEVPIVSYLSHSLNRPVYLQNDANAGAIAEWRFGAGKGCRNMIFMTFGTGMGSGLILDGHLYEGTSQMAGEIGHIRLEDDGPEGYHKKGSFEGFCSGGGIAKLGAMMIKKAKASGQKSLLYGLDESTLTAKTIAEAAKAGDALAKAIYHVSARELGKGLSFLIDVLNPEKIVIGSIFAREEQLFHPMMEEVIEKETLSQTRCCCTIVPSALGENIGDFAAIAVAAKGDIYGDGTNP